MLMRVSNDMPILHVAWVELVKPGFRFTQPRLPSLLFGLWLLSLAAYSSAQSSHPPLQPIIDAAKPGAILLLEPGTYAGPVEIEKSITLDGQGQVTIDGGGTGTVVVVDADGTQLRNLRIVNTGRRHNSVDAAIKLSGRFNVIKGVVIEEALFGIVLNQADNNVIRRNRISSFRGPIAQRGDAIRLWYSFHNKVVDNRVSEARDVIVLDSGDNEISRNRVQDGRYSLSIINSDRMQVTDNLFLNNESGVFTLKASGVLVRDNTIAYANSPGTGVGLAFKDTSNAVVENNIIHHVNVGLALDISPENPEDYNRFTNNLVANSAIGVRFLSDWSGNRFTGNHFYSNHSQVVVRGGGNAQRNLWQGNYWDDYEGFDQDGDGVGDTPYSLYAYADQLWMDTPMARFFLATPSLTLMDFLSRLAPFTDPVLLLQDGVPSTQVGEMMSAVEDCAPQQTASLC